LTIKHVLPGENGGDVEWFFRQNPFEQEAVRKQVAFKRQSWPDVADGRNIRYPQHTYPHILPAGCEILALYQPLAIPILNYFSEEDIALHTELRNLKSSQAACLNFLFPFRQDVKLAKLVFSPFLPEVVTITGIEFEYTGPPEITDWLGEPIRGKRGQNRTSIDVAIFWTDINKELHASLVEWKYCEQNFGTCSTYGSAGKEQKARCEGSNSPTRIPLSQFCLLTDKSTDRPRRYWDHLPGAGILLEALEAVSGCPFRGPFYQLMRQCEVAAFLKECGLVNHAEVLSISFADNNALLEIPVELTPLVASEETDIITLWNGVLLGVAPVRHITVEKLMESIDRVPHINIEWRGYIRNRYGV